MMSAVTTVRRSAKSTLVSSSIAAESSDPGVNMHQPALGKQSRVGIIISLSRLKGMVHKLVLRFQRRRAQRRASAFTADMLANGALPFFKAILETNLNTMHTVVQSLSTRADQLSGVTSQSDPPETPVSRTSRATCPVVFPGVNVPDVLRSPIRPTYTSMCTYNKDITVAQATPPSGIPPEVWKEQSTLSCKEERVSVTAPIPTHTPVASHASVATKEDGEEEGHADVHTFLFSRTRPKPTHAHNIHTHKAEAAQLAKAIRQRVRNGVFSPRSR
jgi:hypothetical protein